MSILFLATKLFIPPPAKSLVVRSRLLERLNEVLQPSCRLVLLSAPAGFGKTTLLSTWASDLKKPEKSGIRFVAWLSLDERDTDPILFWTYIIAALQTQKAGLGAQALCLLQASPQSPIEIVLETLVNELAGLGEQFVLILDDYHLIRNPTIHRELSFFVEHTPAHFHTILASRSDPPLPLALMRGRGQLLEIRLADLRFTLDETTFFVNQIMQLVLTDEEIDTLNHRTEGWIVGLQMAAISMQRERDHHAFVSAFSGNDRYIADYLIEEVLEGQTEEVQRFLLETSILDHLTAPLCEAVTGILKGQELLTALEKTNLFILPLDTHREWFRYHQLFADLLQHKLTQTEGEKNVRRLEQRAVDWLASNGHLKMAAEYATKYGDYELATRLVSSCGQQLLKDGEFNTLLILASSLPDELILGDVRLTCMLAHAANATGHIQRAEQLIRNMEKHLGITIDEFIQKGDTSDLDPLTKATLIELGVINARTRIDQFDLESTFFLSEHLLPYLTRARDSEPFALNSPSNLRGSLLFTFGLAQQLRGYVARAAQTFIAAADEGRQTHNLHIEMLSLGHLGDAQVLAGRLHEAQKTFRQTLAAPAEILQKTPFFGISKAGLGNISYEWNELKPAEEYFRAAIEQGLWWRNWENLLPGYLGLARIHAARGDWDAAFKDLADLTNSVQEKEGLVQTSVGAIGALLNLRQGNIDTAEAWAIAYEPERACDYMVEWEEDALVGCRVWILRGQAERADGLLARIISEARNDGRIGHVLEALCIRSTLLASVQRIPDAMTVLDSALQMAESEGYIRTFVDEGRIMQDLLAAAVRAGAHPEYASRLLEAFSTPQPVEPEEQPHIPSAQNVRGRFSRSEKDELITPLTSREHEVIVLIAQGCSNKEVAQKLHVSVRTVKYYTTGIYTKLNVSGRAHAVSKAKELGLLK